MSGTTGPGRPATRRSLTVLVPPETNHRGFLTAMFALFEASMVWEMNWPLIVKRAPPAKETAAEGA